MTKYASLLLPLLAVAACSKGPSGEGTSGEIQPVVGAHTAVVGRRDFTETVAAIGEVTQRPGHFAAMAAPAPTRVSRVFVAVGQPVKAGDPLVEFEQQTFAAALQSAQAGLENAQQEYDRAQRLAQEGIAARKDVEQASATLAQAKAAEVAARRDQELSTLRSPIDGVVTVMTAVLGASADMNTMLVEVTDPHALDVTLQLTADQAGRVRAGQAVAVAAGQSPSGESLGTGRVASVGAELDSATHTVPVRVVVARPTRPLTVGETVMGSIAVGTHPKAIAVPLEGLVPEGEGYRVFVVDSTGMAHARDVTIGARGEQYVEIVKGLSAGETVVTYGAYGVTDSAKIVREKP
jgi:membrane fusion protein (multidrug efflux system)